MDPELREKRRAERQALTSAKRGQQHRKSYAIESDLIDGFEVRSQRLVKSTHGDASMDVDGELPPPLYAGSGPDAMNTSSVIVSDADFAETDRRSGSAGAVPAKAHPNALGSLTATLGKGSAPHQNTAACGMPAGVTRKERRFSGNNSRKDASRASTMGLTVGRDTEVGMSSSILNHIPSDHDAENFIHLVRSSFAHDPPKHEAFIDVMMDFRDGSMDTVQVMEKVAVILQGHTSLIQQFNCFLPDGYRIEPLTNQLHPHKCSYASNGLPDESESEQLVQTFLTCLAARFKSKEPQREAKLLEVYQLLAGADSGSDRVAAGITKLLQSDPELLRELSQFTPRA